MNIKMGLVFNFKFDCRQVKSKKIQIELPSRKGSSGEEQTTANLKCNTARESKTQGKQQKIPWSPGAHLALTKHHLVLNSEVGN